MAACEDCFGEGYVPALGGGVLLCISCGGTGEEDPEDGCDECYAECIMCWTQYEAWLDGDFCNCDGLIELQECTDGCDYCGDLTN